MVFSFYDEFIHQDFSQPVLVALQGLPHYYPDPAYINNGNYGAWRPPYPPAGPFAPVCSLLGISTSLDATYRNGRRSVHPACLLAFCMTWCGVSCVCNGGYARTQQPDSPMPEVTGTCIRTRGAHADEIKSDLHCCLCSPRRSSGRRCRPCTREERTQQCSPWHPWHPRRS